MNDQPDGEPLRDWLRRLRVLGSRPPAMGLRSLPERPEAMFVQWLLEAAAHDVPEPHAMTLSTVDGDGTPNARVLILKDLDDHGWWFATDLLSTKATELRRQPRAALTFYWPTVGRQVRVRGSVTEGSPASSAADFAARGLRSRATVLANEELAIRAKPYDRAQLEALVADWEARMADDANPPQPPVAPPWGTFAVAAQSVEFWQADAGRLHQRVRYLRDGEAWLVQTPAH